MNETPANWRYDPLSFLLGFGMGLIPFFATIIPLLVR